MSEHIMSEPFIEKHAISTELCNVNREKHKLKFHRVCRGDREPSRIPIRSLKSLRNKSTKVREFVYRRILSCFFIYAASGSHVFASSNSLLCNNICHMSRNAERNIKPE